MFVGSNPFAVNYIAQKMKFSIKDFISQCDQICSFRRIWSHLLKKSLMENLIFCAVLDFRERVPVLSEEFLDFRAIT